MSQSSPKITTNSLDSKKDLDFQIKSACETLILNITRSSFDPLILYLKKSTISKEKPNEKEIFEIFEKIKIPTENMIKEIDYKIPLYIQSESNLKNIYQPIHTVFINTYQQFLSFIETHFEDNKNIKIWTMDELKSMFKKI